MNEEKGPGELGVGGVGRSVGDMDIAMGCELLLLVCWEEYVLDIRRSDCRSSSWGYASAGVESYGFTEVA